MATHCTLERINFAVDNFDMPPEGVDGIQFLATNIARVGTVTRRVAVERPFSPDREHLERLWTRHVDIFTNT